MGGIIDSLTMWVFIRDAGCRQSTVIPPSASSSARSKVNAARANLLAVAGLGADTARRLVRRTRGRPCEYPERETLPGWRRTRSYGYRTEAIIHMAFYAGWPNAMTAITQLKTLIEAKAGRPAGEKG
jgi:hypothetical protein